MYDDDGFLPLDECARRMNMTEEQVLGLVAKHALRARRYGGWGPIEVEPAIVNVAPSKAAKRPPATRRPAKRTR
jgi:hypothetical protein